MKSIEKLTKIHDGTKKYNIVQGNEIWSNQGTYVEYEYLTEMREEQEELIFQAAIKINLKTKKGRELARKVIKNQDSPIKKYLQEYDKWNKKDKEEGKPYNEYIFTDKIMEILNKDNK